MTAATWIDDLQTELHAQLQAHTTGAQGESPYVADPTGWARDRVGAHLWSKQRDIARSVVEHRRTAVKSGHGPGKTWTAGMLACWWIDAHPPGQAIVVTTAPTAPQMYAQLWAEIRTMHRKGGLAGVVLQNGEWKIDDTLVGIGRKPADTDEHGFQGFHRRYVLVILDEACGIPPTLWTGAEAITTNTDCRILAIGNPDDPNTEFGRVCRPGSGWNVLGVSVLDTPNFTGEAVPDDLRPLLPSPEWEADRRRHWGEESPQYVAKVLGEFPEVGEDTLISPAWIAAAQQRSLQPGWPSVLGVDVARFGSDRTVIYHRRGPVARLHSDRSRDATTQTTGRVTHALSETGAESAQVDGVGVGGGVVDQLDEAGKPVHDMQAGQAAADTERFINARAEWYWGLRQRFEAGDVDLDPGDDELAAQLGALHYTYTARGQIKIESKDDMRRRGMPSPDRADGLMLAFASPHESGKVADTVYALD